MATTLAYKKAASIAMRRLRQPLGQLCTKPAQILCDPNEMDTELKLKISQWVTLKPKEKLESA